MKQLSRLAMILVFVLSLFFYQNSFGQSSEREIGLRLENLQNLDLGFVYKKGKGENKFKRFRLAVLNLGYGNYGDGNDRFALSFGLAIGVEKRKSIADRLQFVHGFEPALFAAYSTLNNQDNLQIRPTLGYVLGFQYNVSERFGINVETIPSLSASFQLGDNNSTDNVYVNAGFNSNAAKLSLIYRFEKK